jgi:ferredoxin
MKAGHPNPITAVDKALAATGLFVRAGFYPGPETPAPGLADGRQAKTVLLVGNAGNGLWQAFRAANPELKGRHPLNSWVNEQLARAAAAVGAEVVDPMRPPYPPIQRWAMAAEGGHQSPLGLLIHPEYGLWHVYRGALLLAETIDLPELNTVADAGPSPCDSCANKPCLNACPVDAFRPAFSPERCVDHVASPNGVACQTRGCLARRACPVGRDWTYDLEPAAYHMAAVVETVQAGRHRGGEVWTP